MGEDAAGTLSSDSSTPTPTSHKQTRLMHHACALSNRVRGKKPHVDALLDRVRVLYGLAVFTVHAMPQASGPAHSLTYVRTPQTRPQQTIGLRTTTRNVHLLKLRVTCLRPFPHGRSPTPTIPLAQSNTEIDL